MKLLKLSIIATLLAGCNKEQKRTMCNYMPPKEYVLMIDTVSGGYTFTHQGYAGIEYLYEYKRIEEYGMYYSTMPTLYKDSCEAKYAIYAYLKGTGATLIPVYHTDTLTR